MKNLVIDSGWKGPPQCSHCDIRKVGIFSALSDEASALIHEPIDEMRVRKGRILYQAGTPANHVFTIREGMVKVVRASSSGEEKIVRLIKRGDVVGIEALLEQNYKATAIVLDDVLTCRIPVSVADRLTNELPQFQHHLLVRWQRCIDQADRWLIELRTGSIKKRAALFLFRLAEAEPSHIIFIPPIPDISNILAVNTSTISRVMAEYKRAGLLKKVEPMRFKVAMDEFQSYLQ